MKKKLLGLLPALLAFNAHADELMNFAELKSAIQNGQNINIVVFVDQCQPNKNSPDPIAVTGAFRPTAFMIVKDQILASDLHFTRNNPGYKEKSIFEFVTYRFSADNSMVLQVQTLKAANYSPLGKESKLNCSIASSVKLFSDAHSAGLILIKE